MNERPFLLEQNKKEEKENYNENTLCTQRSSTGNFIYSVSSSILNLLQLIKK
jgi:hypothetical protein